MPERISLVLGFDCNGGQLADALRGHADSLGIRTCIAPGSGDGEYPEIAIAAGTMVSRGECTSAILVCYSGLGMSIAANKVPGIRAVRCTDLESVKRARTNCDANVLSLPASLVSVDLGKAIVDEWVSARFDSPQAQAKIDRVHAFERTHLNVP